MKEAALIKRIVFVTGGGREVKKMRRARLAEFNA